MKPFHELQSDLRLAIVRGYHDQALEAAATLIDVLSARLGITTDDDLLRLADISPGVSAATISTLASKVKWEDIEGKPDFCDPSSCACKTTGNVEYTISPSGSKTFYVDVDLSAEETAKQLNEYSLSVNGAVTGNVVSWADWREAIDAVAPIAVGGPPGSDVGMANAATAMADQLDLFNGAPLSAFDHDGDGKPGGSKKKPKTPKE